MPKIEFKFQPQVLTSDASKAVDGEIERKILVLKMQPGESNDARSATIAGKVRLLKDKDLNHSDSVRYANRESARADLRGLAEQLCVGGKVARGFLRQSEDGTVSNNGTGDWAAAVKQIRERVKAAYGDALGDKGMNENGADNSLDKIIDDYLAKSGKGFGTRSLVALVKKLEAVSGNESNFLAGVNVGSKRIATESLASAPLPKDSHQAWQAIDGYFKAQSEALTKGERTAVETEFVLATCKNIHRTSATFGRHDFDISGFIDLKIKERLATDRGMTAAGFMKLVKEQASDALLGKDAANHPNAAIRKLYEKMKRAMNDAATLDDFYDRVGTSVDETRSTIPFVDDFGFIRAAQKALDNIAKSRSPELIPPDSPFGSVQKQDDARAVDMPNLRQITLPTGQVELFGPPAGANDLFRFGVSLLTTALDLHDKETGQAQGGSRASRLIGLIERTASEAKPDLSVFDSANKIVDFEEELNTLLGDQARPDSALAFGRDCLISALLWREDHIVPIVESPPAADHPIPTLKNHPYIRRNSVGS